MTCNCEKCPCNSAPTVAVPRLNTVQFFLDHPNAKLPTREHNEANGQHNAGYDVYSSEGVVVPARGRAIVPTGLRMSVEPDWYCRVAPRSGLAVKNGIDVGAGVVDSNYRGLLGVVLFNFSDSDYTVQVGDRVAQLIFTPCGSPDLQVVDTVEQLGTTERGNGGYGSTGHN